MDVICERCGTEYEFDGTLLSGRGTSVKCTNCGHVFKVYPRRSVEGDRTTSIWRLRMKNGTEDVIDTLRELQRRISCGEVTPEDEIARGDEGWKALGSIPELETFFQAAGFETAPPPSSSPIPPGTSQSSDSSLPPGRRQRQPTLLGVSPVRRVVESDAASAAAQTPETASRLYPAPAAPAPTVTSPSAAAHTTGPTAAEASYRSPYTRDSVAGVPKVEIEDAEFEESAATPTSSGPTPHPAYYSDDEDIPDLPGRAASPLRWLLLLLLVGGVALAATHWERVAQMFGSGVEPEVIAAEVDAGDAAVAEGHLAAYERAIEAYGRAAGASANDDSEVLARLSNAFALAAQAHLDDDANADIADLSSSARSAAQAAVRLDPQGIEPRLALIDTLRLEGVHGEARKRLEDLRAVSFSRTAEFFRIDARLSAAEADGRLENGLRSARRAAELDPDGARYLLLAARAELAAENPQRARTLLQQVLASQPEHPVATALMAGVTASEQESAPEAEPEVAAETEAGATVQTAAAEAVGEPSAEAEVAPVPPAKPAPEPREPRAASKSADAEPAKEPAPAPPPKEKSKAKPARKSTTYDEYDRLARAASDDAFVDGRPPLADYESTMAKGRQELAAGNYARARAYFDTALEAYPGSADAMDALGDVATAVRDHTSALRYYRVAAQRGQSDGYFKLGITYERLGKTEEAVSAYYTYIQRYPDGRHAAEAKRAIKTLEPRAQLPPEPGTEPAR